MVGQDDAEDKGIVKNEREGVGYGIEKEVVN
jgi:hypothetical protein